MSRYQEDALKLAYYKKEIIKEMTRIGMAPSQLGVQQRLDDIDEVLSVFRYVANEGGDKVNVAQLKKAFTTIAIDLAILYQAVVNYRRKELKQLTDYVDARLSSLEQTATNYETILSNDLARTALGKAIYVQVSNYIWSYANGNFTINLPDITTKQNKNLYFLLSAEDKVKEASTIFFTMEGKQYSAVFTEDIEAVRTSLTNNAKKYSFTRSAELNNSGEALLLNCDGLTADASKGYTVLAGKNKCVKKVNDAAGIISCNQYESIPATAVTEYSLTVYNGTYLKINTSAAPAWSNVEVNKDVKTINEYQQVKLTMPFNSAWQIVTDGTIYAYCREGAVVDSKLYYPNSEVGSVTDYLVLEETAPENIVLSDVAIVIASDTAAFPTINYIAIKEADAK